MEVSRATWGWRRYFFCRVSLQVVCTSYVCFLFFFQAGLPLGNFRIQCLRYLRYVFSRFQAALFSSAAVLGSNSRLPSTYYIAVSTYCTIQYMGGTDRPRHRRNSQPRCANISGPLTLASGTPAPLWSSILTTRPSPPPTPHSRRCRYECSVIVMGVVSQFRTQHRNCTPSSYAPSKRETRNALGYGEKERGKRSKGFERRGDERER
ncbi:hypothetical protein B0T26DRAFT_527399 [Lasiosphaeria miniovina]|uniref:Uncharacterized protein n=1 Tax=Lasiosphaeria miniovina TaxID=1954250 RepID=A0AA39ZQD0_9PEZI|nr:uncharacterized protein B0T26DRAFT_527399 [Lasiosphaeria miniovina]KAK0701681.1 hypothetical protein B0T26DRAFT_527399 [Lasiosphaeria miniovina]